RLPVESVAQMAKLSWSTVARVDGRAIELALGDRTAALENLRWIGVDEVSRTGGHVYFTIVTDLESGRVVWIGDGKGRRGLLPLSARENLEHKHKLLLKELMELNQPLYQAYLRIRVADRLANHLDAIIAGHQQAVPLGLVESINSKIAALRSQARGYRDPEYF